MEKILESVSNPYSQENFERLVYMFLNNKDEYTFYSDVVTYYKDRVDKGNVNRPTVQGNFMRVDSLNLPGWTVQRYFSEFFPTEHRLYINAPINHIGTIVDDFVSRCVAQNLPFELKYATENEDRNDSIVIGSNTEVYQKHIDILRQFAKEHPEIVEDCGTPPLLTGVLDGWIGMADENVANRYISYTQSRLNIFKRSIYKYLSVHPEIATQIEANKKFLDNPPLNFSLTLENKQKLEEYISQNSQVLKEIYKEFFDECERSGIDTENPIFYKGSREGLLRGGQVPKLDITDEIREKIRSTTATGVANLYLESEHRNELSAESNIEILKSIFEKEVNDRMDAELVYEDLNFLGKIGLIDSSFAGDLYPDESLECLDDYLNTQSEISVYYGYTKRPLTELFKSQNGNLSPEKIKQIISERKEYIIDYLTAPQLPIDQKRQRIQNDRKLSEEFSKDRFFPFKVRMLLEYQMDLLEDDIEHDDERQALTKDLVKELQEKTQDDIDVDKILRKFKPQKSEWDYDEI